MSGANDDEEGCDFCKRGRVTEQTREISFREKTSKGYVFCRVTIPIAICDQCGAESFGVAAERIMEAAVRRAFKKLP